MGSERVLRLYVGAIVLRHQGENCLYSASWTAHSADEARGGMVAKVMADKPGCSVCGVSVAVVPDDQIAAVATPSDPGARDAT